MSLVVHNLVIKQPSPQAARSFLNSSMSCDVIERYSPALSQTSRGQRIKRERLGTRLVIQIFVVWRFHCRAKRILIPVEPQTQRQ